MARANRHFVPGQVWHLTHQLGSYAIGRKIRELAEGFELREPEPVYNGFFEVKNDDIHTENCLFWNV